MDSIIDEYIKGQLKQNKFKEFSNIYLQRRNKLNEIVRYCIKPLDILYDIKVIPNVYGFLMCKKILL